ncbi:MAG: bacillithiol system redox-active protein YtxJ [Bacteroidota bacterium]
MSFWQALKTPNELQLAIDNSISRPCLFLKHSTRCSLSAMAKNRIEKSIDTRFDYFIIDVIRHRDVSDGLSRIFDVQHESPQAFLVMGKKLLEVESHLAISPSSFSTLIDSVE